jgi:hypothetical protein
MKIDIPETLKADLPQNLWGKILQSTPIVMAVIATMLAGLASSEMTRAQYDRSLASQRQAKVGDQWGLFQAKRLRGALQLATLDLLEATTGVHPLDPAALARAVEPQPAAAGEDEVAKLRDAARDLLGSPAGRAVADRICRGALPDLPPAAPVDPKVKAALEAIAGKRAEQETAALVGQLEPRVLEQALRGANDDAQAFDTAIKPAAQLVDLLDDLLVRRRAAQPESLARDFAAVRLRFHAVRYEAEARFNQAIANLIELQVQESNLTAERHYARSQQFFIGMLAAQLAVISATFAIAARKRNFLWSVAAAAGLIAVAVAAYVYFYV